MPIRAEYRKYYDARWRKFRLSMLEAAGNVCQICHQPHRLLNVVHLSHDPADRKSLTVLCPSCHSKFATAQRIAMTRRTRARKYGQMWLSEELEVAPLPVRMWPMRLRQMNLF
jgi:5-methylcytosine-specific restriction endonuclease McrA